MKYSSDITIYPVHKGAPVSNDYTIHTKAGQVPVYYTCSRYGPDICFAYFDANTNAPVEVTVSVNFTDVKTAVILPEKYSICPDINDNTLTFSVPKSDTYLSIIINDDFIY